MTPGATPTLPCSGIFGIPDPYPDSVRVAEVDDQRRMAAILAYDAVRMPPRAELQGVVELAARIAGVPKATVNIITDTEQHQIATTGFEGSVSPRRDSMCAAILGAAQPVVVADASRDARFARNPSVTGQIDTIRCYVAHPLITRDGVPVGTLCVFDSEARELDTEQLAGLALLAARTVDVFEVRLRGRELALSLMENQAVQAELERSNERLASFAGQVSHDLKTPLTTLSLTLSLIREQLEDGQVGAESTALLDRAIHVSERMADLIDDVLDYARLGGTFRATEVDLDFVLGKVLEDLAPELADVTMHIGQLPTVLGDRAQLSAVLQNLHRERRPLPLRRAPARGAHRRQARAARVADRDHRQRPRRTARRAAPHLRAPRARRRLDRGHGHRPGHLPQDRRRARRPDRHRRLGHRGR